jgi:hypothetical protein
MGLKCSLFGHAFDERDVVQERESTGSQVVTVAKDVERCSRCGSTRIVSTNKEVVSATNATADGGVDAEPSIRTPGEGQGAGGGPDTAPTAGVNGGPAGGEPTQGAQAPGREQPAGDGVSTTAPPNGGGRRADVAGGNSGNSSNGGNTAAPAGADAGSAPPDDTAGAADGALDGIVDRSDEGPADGVQEGSPDATDGAHGPERATPPTGAGEPAGEAAAVTLDPDEAATPEPDPAASGPATDAGLDSEPDPSSEDAEILGSAETRDRAPGRWPGDETADPWEPAPLDGEEDTADGAPSASTDGDDATGSPEAEPAVSDDGDGAAAEPSDEDAEILDAGGGDGSTDPTGSTPDTVAEPAPEVDESPEPAATATFTVPSGQYRCPECGHRIDADSSFRVGDACPECVQGFLTADD